MERDSYRLLDDFNGDLSSFGNPWEGFSDRVMGGISDLSVRKTSDEEGKYIRMTGNVSLENNGGFIQIRQIISNPLNPFDGSIYKGIRLRSRGKGDNYYIFLRTTNTLFPWQYYSAKINLRDSWSTIDIPWSDFVKGDYGTLGKFRENKLKSLAIVAYGEDFEALIDIQEIGFYK